MFEDVKKGDEVLITESLKVPGTHSVRAYRKMIVARVFPRTFVVDGLKFHKHNGYYAGENRYIHREVKPIGGKFRETTLEEECAIGENVACLNLVADVAKKINARNNARLISNKAACDFIKAAMLEINKLLHENP